MGFYSIYGASPSTNLFYRDSNPYNVSYRDWISKWWQWNIAIPKDQHPIINTSLTQCASGKSGPVTFLSHSIDGNSKYICTIGVNQAILVPIGYGECTEKEANSNQHQDMYNCFAEGDKFLTFTASLDGEILNGLEQNYAVTKIFNIAIPYNNFLNHTAGQYKDVAGGYFIFLQPLLSGDHKIDISATVLNPIHPKYNFHYDTEYLIHVQ